MATESRAAARPGLRYEPSAQLRCISLQATAARPVCQSHPCHRDMIEYWSASLDDNFALLAVAATKGVGKGKLGGHTQEIYILENIGHWKNSW